MGDELHKINGSPYSIQTKPKRSFSQPLMENLVKFTDNMKKNRGIIEQNHYEITLKESRILYLREQILNMKQKKDDWESQLQEEA